MFKSLRSQLLLIFFLTVALGAGFALSTIWLALHITGTSGDELNSGLKHIANIGYIELVVVIVITTALYTRLILSVRQSLKAILKGIDRVSKGDLTRPIVLETDDEFGEIARYFNAALEVTKKAQEEAVSQSSSLLQKNAQLEDVKIAMLNILEDTKELEEQLRNEKEQVEAKVRMRTRELYEERARLEASINSLESGFLMTLLTDNEVVTNPALRQFFGIVQPTDSLAGKRADEFMTAIQQKLPGINLSLEIKKCIETRQPFHFDNVMVGERYVTISGAPIISKQEQSTAGSVILVNDTTEAKMLERSKDEFVSIASHELRTPLTAIKGNAELLIQLYGDQLVNDEVRQMVSDIQDGSVRLISIVNQFLTMSRLEQGRTMFTLEPVDLYKSVRQAVDSLKTLADQKKLTLTAELPEGLPQPLADTARLGEVLVNLIGNAIKYTDEGSVKLTALMDGNKLRVSVSDTGKGIDPKNQNLLFRKFQQASSSILTRDDSRSTGLGLYITKLLIEQMGGTIELLSSVPDEGSVFSFTIPVASGEKYASVKSSESEVLAPKEGAS